MNEYCAESLLNIEFQLKPHWISIEHFEKPFVNVEIVEFFRSDLQKQFPSFAEWFPNVRLLTLDDDCRLSCITSPIFQQLNELNININNNVKDGFTTEKAIQLVQQHPQLHNLNIHVSRNGITLNTLSDIIKDNPNIRKILVTQTNPTTVFLSDVQQFMFPLLVELDLSGYTFGVEEVLSIIQQLNSLEQFKFRMVEYSDSRKYDSLVAQLDSQWQSDNQWYVMKHCNSIVTLQRRNV